jgi:hypothetical protein
VRQSALFSLLCTALICGCKKRGEKEAKKRITHTPDGENEKNHMAEENEKSQENGEKDKGTDSDGGK